MRGRYFTAIIAIGTSVVFAACGGDEDDGDGGETAPQPRGSIEQAAEQHARAIESGDCRELFAVARHSTKRTEELSEGNAPPSKDECQTLEQYAKSLKGYRAGASRSFDTAAVVDGTAKGAPVTTVFVLDLDGQWKVAVTSGVKPQAGSKPAPDNEFDDNVAKFVDAARAGDCRKVFRLTSADADVIEGLGKNRQEFCKNFPQASRHRRSFFSRVKKGGDARPVALGKTREFAFYALAVKPGIYYTLFASRQPEGLPVTPKHERDGVYEWYLARE